MKKNVKKINIVRIFMVILLIAILSSCVYFALNGITNSSEMNDKTKIDNPDVTPIPDKPIPSKPIDNEVVAIDRLGNKIKANQTIPMQSFAFACANTSINKSIVLNATVLPENATDKTLNWSISWQNGSSDFANGKKVTDFVTITPSSNTMSCVINYIADFGEKIIITASSVLSPDVKTECKVDCIQKLASNTNITQSMYTSELNHDYVNSSNKNTEYIFHDITDGLVYTLKNDIKKVTASIGLSSTFINFCNSKNINYSNSRLDFVLPKYVTSAGSTIYGWDLGKNRNYRIFDVFNELMLNNYDKSTFYTYFSANKYEQIKNSRDNYVKNNTAVTIIFIVETTYFTKEIPFEIYFDKDLFITKPSSISFDKPTVVL